MKFTIKLSGKTLLTIMRACGYTPSRELTFHRFITGRRYPKFHIYARILQDNKSAVLNLHLDQKRPSYKGTHAHSGEYEGPLLQAEAERIRLASEASRI